MEPKTLYRWEKSAGLEHACGTCGTKQGSPKARQRCFGIHTEPCYRYHSVMHFLGASHNCGPCIIADEQHEKRHSIIAELVNEYKNYHGTEYDTATPVRKRSKKDSISREEPLPANETADNKPEHGVARELLAATTMPESYEDKQDVMSLDDEDAEGEGPTGHQLLSLVERRALKREVKAEKSLVKAAKNQQKHTIAVRREDIVAVARAIHGDKYGLDNVDGHPLATDRTIEHVIQRNVRFVSALKSHRHDLLRALAQQRDLASSNKKRASSGSEEVASSTAEVTTDHVTAILARLGINATSSSLAVKSPVTTDFGTPGNGKKTKAEILQKLSVAIAQDLQKHENEQEETCKRAAGFWRYANKEVLARMTRNALEINWKTGAMLKKTDRYGLEDAGGLVEAADNQPDEMNINGSAKLTDAARKGETLTNEPDIVDAVDSANMENVIPSLGSGEDEISDSYFPQMKPVEQGPETPSANEQRYSTSDFFSSESSPSAEIGSTQRKAIDVYSLSILDHACAKDIGEYFERNGKLSNIRGHFIQRKAFPSDD